MRVILPLGHGSMTTPALSCDPESGPEERLVDRNVLHSTIAVPPLLHAVDEEDVAVREHLMISSIPSLSSPGVRASASLDGVSPCRGGLC